MIALMISGTTYGDAIRNARKKAGLTQKELAQKTGLAEITIRQYENNKREPKIETLQKIENAVGDKIGNLIYDLLYNTNEVNIVEPKTDELREEVAALRYSLNDDGLAKTRDYMRDLIGNPKYKVGN